jgi:putative MFS transporter
MSTRTAININSTGASTSSPSWNPLSVDDAIDRLGYGRFQQRLLVAAGLCSASDAMEILLLSFLAMSVQIEWDLSMQQTNALLSVVFAGAFVGTLGLGRLGDVGGRKLAFVVTAATVAIFGLLSCLCQTFEQLLLARFFVGVGIGGSTVPFDTYSEFLPKASRGQTLALPSYFWTTGTVFVAILAHFILGDNASHWRLLCLASSIPCIVATLVGMWVVPESPRWLLLQPHRQPEAWKILRQAVILNGKDPHLIFPPGTILKEEDDLQDSATSFGDLLSPQWRRLSLTLWLVWACYALMYYGTVLAVTLVFSSDNSNNKNDEKKSLYFDYNAILISTLAEVAGATVVLLTIDRLGRRTMHATSFLLGGSMVLVLCLAVADYKDEHRNRNRSLVLLLAFLARMFIFSGSAITWIWTVELLPTNLRSTGHSVANASARIGGLLAPYLVSPTTPFPIMGLILMAISLILVASACQLPETHGAPMGMMTNNHHPVRTAGYQKVVSNNPSETVELLSLPKDSTTSSHHRVV